MIEKQVLIPEKIRMTAACGRDPAGGIIVPAGPGDTEGHRTGYRESGSQGAPDQSVDDSAFLW